MRDVAEGAAARKVPAPTTTANLAPGLLPGGYESHLLNPRCSSRAPLPIVEVHPVSLIPQSRGPQRGDFRGPHSGSEGIQFRNPHILSPRFLLNSIAHHFKGLRPKLHRHGSFKNV